MFADYRTFTVVALHLCTRLLYYKKKAIHESILYFVVQNYTFIEVVKLYIIIVLGIET